jgi:hypothetical protein
MGLNPTIDHQRIVAEERAKVGGMPPGNERGWTVTNQTCLRLVALGEDAGLLAKAGGTNWLGYSIDRVMYRDSGAIYDCLGDGEGAATPQWNFDGTVDPALWRAPIGDVPTPPDPPDPPDPVECPCQAQLTAIQAQLDQALGLLAALGIGVDTVLAEMHTGLWDANLSVKLLGSVKGTVGPMKS